MAVDLTYSTHGLSDYTKTILLQRIAKQLNNAGILRGNLTDVVLCTNGSVIVLGAYKSSETKTFLPFRALFIPEDFNLEFLKNLTLKINEPPKERRLVWNIEVCELIKKQYGLLLQPGDFIPVKLDPSANSITLRFVPYHPFFKGSITIAIIKHDQQGSIIPQSESTDFKSVDCSKVKALFANVVLGDLLTEHQIYAIINSSAPGYGWNFSPAKAELNLYSARVKERIDGNIVIEFDPYYQTIYQNAFLVQL